MSGTKDRTSVKCKFCSFATMIFALIIDICILECKTMGCGCIVGRSLLRDRIFSTFVQFISYANLYLVSVSTSCSLQATFRIVHEFLFQRVVSA